MTKRAKIITGIFVVLLILIAGYVQIQGINVRELIKTENRSQDSNIPSAVSKQYNNMREKYDGSFGASIEGCSKDGEFLYIVSGSGGFTGYSYYYTKGGKLIGSQYFSDIIGEGDEAPVDITGYECNTIAKSNSRF